MKLITERMLIKNVAERWLNKYGHGHVYDGLIALDAETATAEQVNAVIGNTFWTYVGMCDECGAIPDAIVQLGQEPDYESATTYICLDCLRKAVALIERGEVEG